MYGRIENELEDVTYIKSHDDERGGLFFSNFMLGLFDYCILSSSSQINLDERMLFYASITKNHQQLSQYANIIADSFCGINLETGLTVNDYIEYQRMYAHRALDFNNFKITIESSENAWTPVELLLDSMNFLLTNIEEKNLVTENTSWYGEETISELKSVQSILLFYRKNKAQKGRMNFHPDF